MISIYHGISESRLSQALTRRIITPVEEEGGYGNWLNVSIPGSLGLAVHMAGREDMDSDSNKALYAALLDGLMETCAEAAYGSFTYVLELLVHEDWVEEDDKGYTWLSPEYPVGIFAIRSMYEVASTPVLMDTAAAYACMNSDAVELHKIYPEINKSDLFSAGRCTDTKLGSLLEQLQLTPMTHIGGDEAHNMLPFRAPFIAGAGRSWDELHGGHADFVQSVLSSINGLREDGGDFKAVASITGTNYETEVNLDTWVNNTTPYRIAMLLIEGQNSKYSNGVLRELGKYDAAAAGILMVEDTLRAMDKVTLGADAPTRQARLSFDLAELEDWLQVDKEDEWSDICAAGRKIIDERRAARNKNSDPS